MAVAAAIAGGGSALIHLLDCSKTDRSGLRRPTASALLERFAGRTLVVVDSCQLRCPPEQIRADLRAGFMVMITGSKFAGGPPFCGALLLPPGVVAQLPTLELPPGLLAQTADDDWPLSLRGRIGGPFAARHNVVQACDGKPPWPGWRDCSSSRQACGKRWSALSPARSDSASGKIPISG